MYEQYFAQMNPPTLENGILKAFDCETTGLATRSVDQAFLVVFTKETGVSNAYYGDMDCSTRKVFWSDETAKQILDELKEPGVTWVASNAKFDMSCVEPIIKRFFATHEDLVTFIETFLKGCHDTIMEHHALVNDEEHGLKFAAVKYGDMPDTDESALRSAVAECRKDATGFAIASEVTCPHVKKPRDGWGVMDYWVPREYARVKWENSQCYRMWLAGTKTEETLKKYPGWNWRPPGLIHSTDKGHHFWTVCEEYCVLDTVRSIVLHKSFKKTLQATPTYSINGKATLWDIYLANRPALVTTYFMEDWGITLREDRFEPVSKICREDAHDAMWIATKVIGMITPVNLASPIDVRRILYDLFNLPVTEKTKAGHPSTDAKFVKRVVAACITRIDDTSSLQPPRMAHGVESLQQYFTRLDGWAKDIVALGPASPEMLYCFCNALLLYKSAVKSLESALAYARASVPVIPGFKRLQPSFNPVGPRSTRMSSSNPNGQNITDGKKNTGTGFFTRSHSMKGIFGPLPGREWWSWDYHQMQLIIFAVACGDKQMLKAAEAGLDFHTVMAQRIFGLSEKEAPTDRQRRIAKAVNFGFIFGAQPKRIEAESGVENLFDILLETIPTAVQFIKDTERKVRLDGYVLSLDGYRLYVPKEQAYSGVNYIVQGTEGTIVKAGQLMVFEYIRSLRKRYEDAIMNITVHDDTIIDSVSGFLSPENISTIGHLFELASTRIGVPCTVSCKHITTVWDEGKDVEMEEVA